GRRPVPARGGAVPRGGAAGSGAVVETAAPREGSPAQRRRSNLLLRAHPGAAVAVVRRRRAAVAPGADGNHPARIRGDASLVHGPAADHSTSLGVVAAVAAVVGVA